MDSLKSASLSSSVDGDKNNLHGIIVLSYCCVDKCLDSYKACRAVPGVE